MADVESRFNGRRFMGIGVLQIVVVSALWTVTLAQPDHAVAQTTAFGPGPVEIVSEWSSLDRGDGSGEYQILTAATDPATGVTIEHDLSSERSMDGEVTSSESVRVLAQGDERARATSDPAALGSWSEPAIGYAIAFGADFSPEARSNYRPQDKRVREVIQAAVPAAVVSTRRGSDGRTTGTVELPEARPADALAADFLAVRQALRAADLGLAKLRITGRALPPTTPSIPLPPATPSVPLPAAAPSAPTAPAVTP